MHLAMWLVLAPAIAVLFVGLFEGPFGATSWGASSAASPAAAVSQSRAVSPAAHPSAAHISAAASAGATHAAAAPTPAPTEQENVIGFLGGAIAWYRQSNAETSLVKEPSEALYVAADQGIADEILKLAFDYADAAAALIAKSGSPAQSQGASGQSPTGPAAILQLRLTQVRQQMSADAAQVKDLNARVRAASRRDKDALTRQLVAAQAQLEVAQARADFLNTMSQFEAGSSPASPTNTLQSQVDELRKSLENENKPKAQATPVPPPPLEPNGLVTLAQRLLDLHAKAIVLDQRQAGTGSFAKLVVSTRLPLEKALLSLDASVQQLAQAAIANNQTDIQQSKNQLDQLISQRKLIDTALLPLSKQTMLLQRYNDNLAQWDNQVSRESKQGLQALALHLGGLLVVFGLIATLAIIWRHLAFRYVEDVNRRRQILKVRDATVVVLVILVLLFNFTTELSALATVVGFAAAGIAVALQDVILSIAGYFRLSGRFGIKHGDRVELQGVRGEVVELGLTKLTLLEFGGDGIQSGPTGRLVMIPNSSVFRDKFLNHPGRSLIIWRELRFTLSPDCDFRVIEKELLEVVEAVFAHYRDSARNQLQEMERNLNMMIDLGRPQSRVRLGPDGLQITLRFPVDVRSEPQVVDEISRRLLDYLGREPRLRFVPTGAPNFQPSPAGPAEAAAPAPDIPHEGIPAAARGQSS
jgi:small-conductance mechanosensitive channel